MLSSALRPVCLGLALFFSLMTAWYLWRLTGPVQATMGLSAGLLALALLAGAVWLERNHLAPRLAHPVAVTVGLAVVAHCLLLLVSTPDEGMTTHLMIALMGFGCLLLSFKWFLLLAGLALAGFAWVVGSRADAHDWHHYALALGESTVVAALILWVRIAAYRRVQLLHLRDQAMMRHLEEANAAAMVAVRAKSEFLANMSHEIRTPMTAMLGMTELLQMTELSADQREFADTIARSGGSLLQIVNDILDFSKIEAGQLRIEDAHFDLHSLLQEVDDMLQIKARQRNLELRLEFPEAIPRDYRGDAGRLRQVLINLVGNAIKFTEEGSVTQRVTARDLGEGRWALSLAVQDTGIGIAPEHSERIFGAFTQADASTTRRFGGTGLGLAISHKLVALMGGELTLDSELGRGSTFTVALPLRSESKRSILPTTRPPVDPAGLHGKVLLVDDNPDNQNLARQVLEHLGCEVSVATDGEAALGSLQRQRFDLVLMDCHMPGMNGYDTTLEIRRREAANDNDPHTPIVALTASVLPEERERCIEVGMDDYLAKPFSQNELRSVLERWL